MRLRQIHPPRVAGGPFSFVYSTPIASGTLLYLIDSNSVLWKVTIDDSGLLHSVSVVSGTQRTLILNNPGNTVSWQIGINTSGELTTTSVGYNSSYPTTLTLVSMTGLTAWNLGVTTAGLLTTTQV